MTSYPQNLVCFNTFGSPNSWTLETYLKHDGYKAWRRVLAGELTPPLLYEVIGALSASPADIQILQLGYLFGWTNRINDPATSFADNRSWRLPWPVEDLETRADARAVSGRLAAWARESGRLSDRPLKP